MIVTRGDFVIETGYVAVLALTALLFETLLFLLTLVAERCPRPKAANLLVLAQTC